MISAHILVWYTCVPLSHTCLHASHRIASRCSAVQCSAVQCSAVQCSAVQCSAVQCSAVQCSAYYVRSVQKNKLQSSLSWLSVLLAHCLLLLLLLLCSYLFPLNEGDAGPRLRLCHLRVAGSTTNIYTYTPIIQSTVYIVLIRHCKRLLVVVYKSLSRTQDSADAALAESRQARAPIRRESHEPGLVSLWIS